MSGGGKRVIKFKKIDPRELEWEASLGGSLGTETVRKYKRAKARLEMGYEQLEINCLCSEYRVRAACSCSARSNKHVVIVHALVFMYVAC